MLMKERASERNDKFLRGGKGHQKRYQNRYFVVPRYSLPSISYIRNASSIGFILVYIQYHGQ